MKQINVDIANASAVNIAPCTVSIVGCALNIQNADAFSDQQAGA
jgi:hypothetical protein